MKIEYTEKASEQLSELSRMVQERIRNKLDFYIQQPDPLHFAKRLSGAEEYRFRIGEYRVIFEIYNKVLYVLLVIKRDKAYRDL